MVGCEKAKSPRQQRLLRLSIRLTAVNRMAATGSSISIALTISKSEQSDAPGTLRWIRRVFPHPFPRWEVVREGFSI